MDLRLHVTYHDQTTVVSVVGDVDLATVPTLHERLVRLVDEGPERIVVSLEGAEHLDSVALGVLIGARRRAVQNGVSFALVATQPRIRRIFELCGLLEVFDWEEEA